MGTRAEDLAKAGSLIDHGMSFSAQSEGSKYWYGIAGALGYAGYKSDKLCEPANLKLDWVTNKINSVEKIEEAIALLNKHRFLPDAARRLRAKLGGQAKCGTAADKRLLLS